MVFVAGPGFWEVGVSLPPVAGRTKGRTTLPSDALGNSLKSAVQLRLNLKCHMNFWVPLI